MSDALDRGAREECAEVPVIKGCQHRQARRGQIVARLQFRFLRRCGELVPGTDGEAIVASIDAIADRDAKFACDLAAMLDRQIRDAAPCIEPVWRGKRLRRADIETGAASPAMILFRLVGGEIKRRENRPEKEPGSELARH